MILNNKVTTEIYTLSLHDALPIWQNVYHKASCEGPQKIMWNYWQNSSAASNEGHYKTPCFNVNVTKNTERLALITFSKIA